METCEKQNMQKLWFPIFAGKRTLLLRKQRSTCGNMWETKYAYLTILRFPCFAGKRILFLRKLRSICRNLSLGVQTVQDSTTLANGSTFMSSTRFRIGPIRVLLEIVVWMAREFPCPGLQDLGFGGIFLKNTHTGNLSSGAVNQIGSVRGFDSSGPSSLRACFVLPTPF
jgi:hypothetical protein